MSFITQGRHGPNSECYSQREGKRGDIWRVQVATMYISLVFLGRGREGDDSQVDGVDRVKQNGQYNAPPSPVSRAENTIITGPK
jgi:hypothetical protein